MASKGMGADRDGGGSKTDRLANESHANYQRRAGNIGKSESNTVNQLRRNIGAHNSRGTTDRGYDPAGKGR